MEQYKQEFIEFMVDCKVLKFGILLRKAEEKHRFCKYSFTAPEHSFSLGEYYAKAIENKFGFDFDVLFGPAYKKFR